MEANDEGAIRKIPKFIKIFFIHKTPLYCPNEKVTLADERYIDLVKKMQIELRKPDLKKLDPSMIINFVQESWRKSRL